MNLSELQADLRHFAAERDWQAFHTPKNLSTALMVEAAELAEVFQWMTPEESRLAHQDPARKQCIADEVADVLLYLLQLADHSEIDIEHAVSDKLARNGMKYPAKRQIARVSPARASVPGTHVLLDYENVQPSEGELRAMVPDASRVWVFHGPHQHEVERRFASFGNDVTAVPISKTGKNALDFHLSFYMGYIASRNPASTIVVVANDKGYEPMLEHAKGMGFAVRRQSHGKAQPAAKKVTPKKPTPKKATPKKATPMKEPVKKTVAKKATVKKPAAKQVPPTSAAKKVPPIPTAKKAPTLIKVAPEKKTAPVKIAVATSTASAADKMASPPSRLANVPVASPALSLPATSLPVTPGDITRITENLRTMGGHRPTRPASLRRLLKSLLAAETGDDSIEVALGKLVEAGVVAIGTGSQVAYPAFDPQPRAASAAV